MRDQLFGGRYRLVRQLGEGGMGQVWEAEDESLGRHVAVKVISLLAGGGSHGTEARARFLREARITARLQHPNIVTIHDLGETGTGDSQAPFLVMELVRGEGLDALLRRDAVTLPDAAHWGGQICDALADAHHAGIMHRDIKPSNILIMPSGAVKVLDFGVARAADPYATTDRLTQTGFIVGTPPYMAPEQARGFPEPRSDLYALGCLLFELITGQLPFQAPDTVGYLSAHLTQDPPTPSSVSTGIPPAWDDLVLTLLHKDPDKRYPNAASLAQALRRLDHTHVPATAGPSRIPPQMESRAALLARLATAMRAAHEVAATRIPDALSHTRHLQYREASELTTTVQPPPLRTLPLDGTQQPSHPDGPFTRGQPPVTISFTRGQVVAQLAGRRTWQGMGMGLLVGVLAGFTTGSGPIIGIGSFVLKLDDPTGNRLLAGVIAFGIAAVIGLLTGVVQGLYAKSDVVTVGNDGFAVVCRCHPKREQAFIIRWSAVERIALGGPFAERGVALSSDVRVWFRAGSEPTQAWLTKHGIEKQEDGSFSVYPGNHYPYVLASRLHEPLRTFAGTLYLDPSHAPDPA